MIQPELTAKDLEIALNTEIIFLSSRDSFRKLIKTLVLDQKNSVGDIVSILTDPPLLALWEGIIEKDNYFLNLGVYCLHCFANLKIPLSSLIVYYLINAKNIFLKKNDFQIAFNLPEYNLLRKYIAVLKIELKKWPEIEN